MHLARNQLAFAGAAASGLAGEGKRKPGAQQRRKQRVSSLRRHGTIVAFDGDSHSPAEPTLRWAGMGAQQSLKPGLLAGLLGYRLRVAQQAVFRDFAREIPEASPGRAGILLLIDANPGVTQSRLAQAVGIDRSTLVGVLHALQARNLVERRRGQDRRTNGLWLTRPGRALVASLKRRIRVHERRVASSLTPAERARLLHLLEKLAA